MGEGTVETVGTAETEEVTGTETVPATRRWSAISAIRLGTLHETVAREVEGGLR